MQDCVNGRSPRREDVMVLADAPDFLTLEEAAQILRIGRNQAYELARVGRAPPGGPRHGGGARGAGGGVWPAATGAESGTEASGRAGRASWDRSWPLSPMTI